ncbi:DUF1289 domain-containing protein [Pseudomonas sp. 15FMM2]|uniref:DUF1289 domain-containing protein n=1 Tax=Pseudomonas imrae TaxID=2992837 RepID=A0ACC7PNK5_9PSED
MPDQTIKTPCVGLCSTVYGDLVCRGCKRYHHEVIRWNGYSADEKQAVWLRLEQLLVQVMTSKLEVIDTLRLRQQLEARKIRFMPQQSPYCWAYQLIARGARMISNLQAYGLALLPEFRERPLADLRDAIDREFFLLSEAHYQRYIAPDFLRDAFDPGLIASTRA